MKLKWVAPLLVGIMFTQAHAENKQVFRSEMDKVNYGIGIEVIRNFKNQGMEVDLDLVVEGMKDALAGKNKIPEKEFRAMMTAFQTELRQKQATSRKLAGMDNKKTSQAFMDENKSKEGVVTLPSGLQYKILKASEGRRPTDSDTIECNYRGTLVDGTEFDSSYDTGKPATFKLSRGLILGWKEALKLMPVGSRWQLFIPPNLAYGERGFGRSIGSNQVLVFEIELLAIK